MWLPFTKEYSAKAAQELRFEGIPIPEITTENIRLKECIRKTCEYHVESRYQTYEEVLAALEMIEKQI